MARITPKGVDALAVVYGPAHIGAGVLQASRPEFCSDGASLLIRLIWHGCLFEITLGWHMKTFLAGCVAALTLTAPSAHAIAFPKCSGPAVTSVAGADVVGANAADVKLLSEILLENEADQGRVAYCLSDAQMTNNKNGLSFGFNQYDLATNDKAKGVLVGLLKTARAADSSLTLTETDVAAIDAGKLASTAHKLKAGTDEELVKLMQRVNAALGSPAAKKAIDADYVVWLTATIADLKTRVDMMDDTIGSKTYLEGSVLCRMLVLDYENFFGTMGPMFRQYLAGQSVTLTGGTIHAVGPISFTDIMRFSLSTKQGSGAARDERAEILRRINNVVKFYVSSPAKIALTKHDITWLKSDLSTMIGDGGNAFIKNKLATGQYDVLLKLIMQADQYPK